jgi:hypothetical protein
MIEMRRASLRSSGAIIEADAEGATGEGSGKERNMGSKNVRSKNH